MAVTFGAEQTPTPVDLTELSAHAPVSLSVRFEREFLERDWRPVPDQNSAKDSAAPLVFQLRDAVSGETAELAPERVQVAGDARLLTGSTLGLDWQIVVETAANGDRTVTGRVTGNGERCVSVTAATKFDLTGWTWHDDVRERRAMETGGEAFATLEGSPYGATGKVSIYPFGVISRGEWMLVAETDLAEPRVFRIAAEVDGETFGITWDLGITQGTDKFVGVATFRGRWIERATGGDDAFRSALRIFYEEYPDVARNRVGEAGLWMPFADISKFPNPEDFGFAFFEKVGESGSDVDYAHANGVLTLRYTEPWLYWLPMPGDPSGRTDESAVARMRELARSGDAQANHFGSAGLLGGVRSLDGEIRMKFLDVPWNQGARMEVSTDPDLVPTAAAPVSRAMAEWRDIQGFLEDPRVDGIYLDSMSAMLEMDYNPAAIAAADYPLTFTVAELTPGLSTQIASYEFTAALSNFLHDEGKFVMANFPVADFPFFMPFIDIPGEETVWFAGSEYAPMPERKLNYQRAMSGRKTWGFLLGAAFEEIPEGGIERYFTDCLFYGFMPSFFSHNGADDTYWSNAALYERDRPLFRKYLPLIKRIALAGWRPVGDLRAADDALWVESFGDAESGSVWHANLRNATGAALESAVRLADDGESSVAVEPMTGMVSYLVPGEASPVALAVNEIRPWDVVPIEQIDSEIAFLTDWTSPNGEGAASAANLRSVQRELAAGVCCELRIPRPAVGGEENPMELVVRNDGDAEVIVRGFGGGGSVTVPARKRITESGQFRDDLADASGWIDLAWEIVRADGATFECTRRIRPTFAPAVDVSVASERVVSRDESATVELTLANRSTTEKEVSVSWDGDFGDGDATEPVAGRENWVVRVPVSADGEGSGFVNLRVTMKEGEIFRTKVFVLFAGANASAAAVSGVQIVTDSTFSGYSTGALADGVVDGTNLAWNQAAWASADSAEPHFVRVVFPEPIELSEATLYWQLEGDVRYTSRRGSLVGVTADGETVELGEISNNGPEAATRIEFPARTLKSVEFRQPANGGASERPGILWLSEFELK